MCEIKYLFFDGVKPGKAKTMEAPNYQAGLMGILDECDDNGHVRVIVKHDDQIAQFYKTPLRRVYAGLVGEIAKEWVRMSDFS